MSAEKAINSVYISDDPNISIPTKPFERVVSKPEMVSFSIKRKSGFKAKLDEHYFLKRNSHVIIDAISFLRERS